MELKVIELAIVLSEGRTAVLNIVIWLPCPLFQEKRKCFYGTINSI